MYWFVYNMCVSLISLILKQDLVTCVALKAFNSYRQEPLAATDQREHSRNSYHL